MACIVDLSRPLMESALQNALAQVKRGKNTARNPQFAELYERDIAAYHHAINTLQEKK